MSRLSHVPDKKRLLLERIVDDLSQVPKVEAVVLGGSYASGTHHDASDLDIGLYYFDQDPFSIQEMEKIAALISVQGPPTVTAFYGWGPWVNGGAWIQTEVGKVDFIYRNLNQVERTIDESHQGIARHDYDQQPTYGFHSVIYLAETHICVPLFDPTHQILELKRRVQTYPPRLKGRIIADSLWSAEFALLFARQFAGSADVYNTAGCLTRVASNLTQTLFALNERYFISDKKVMESLTAFSILPSGYVEDLARILARPGKTSDELSHTVADLEALWHKVALLAGEVYQPKFRISQV